MSTSGYLTAMFNNCVPRRQLGSCSVPRLFLSLQRVWLARLPFSIHVHVFQLIILSPLLFLHLLSALTSFSFFSPLLQNFQSDISGMCVEGVFSGERSKQLNMVICEHLFRQGKLDVGERVVQV